MPPLPAVDLESEGEAHFGRSPSSTSLKLFSYSRQAEFYSGSSPSSRIFGNGDISTYIAMHLAPTPADKMRSLKWYGDLNAFIRVCTTTYASGVAVLYQNVCNLSILWAILIDKPEQLGHSRLATLIKDTILFNYFLGEVYGDQQRDLSGEDVRSYKLRRFFFICSHVQRLWGNPNSFTPALSTFFMKHLPADSKYLFPALKRVSWIEKDRSQPKIALRTSPIQFPAFQAFRPSALRFLEFEFHDLSAPLSSVLKDQRSIHRIEEFIAYLHQSFPDFYSTMLCFCRPDYCARPAIRMILYTLDVAVMRTQATVISPDIPHAFFVSENPFARYGIRENVTVDIVTPKGRTFIVNPNARDYYPADGNHIMASLSTVSHTCFSLSYLTNMTVAQISDETIIQTILEPFFDHRDIQFVTLHLESVAVHLKPIDIVRIGARWRQLHRLDLRFSVIREKPKHMPSIEMVRVLTGLCPALEYLHLPDFNILGFRASAHETPSFSLRYLTSTTLMSCEGEAEAVASGLLSLFPNLMDVMTEGISAYGWDSIGKAIHAQLHDAAMDDQLDSPLRLAAGLVAAPLTEQELEDLLLAS